MGNLPSSLLNEHLKQQQEKTKKIAADREKAEAIAKQEQERIKQFAADREKAEAIAKQEQAKSIQEQNKAKESDAQTAAKLIEIAEREKLIPQIEANKAATVANTAELSRVKTANFRWYGWLGLGVVLAPVALYGLDYLWNGFEPTKRLRVWYALNYGKLKLEDEPIFKKIDATRTNKIPLKPQFRPTLLIAPTGSGKSTLLSDIARESRSRGIPVIRLAIRGDIGKIPNDVKKKDGEDKKKDGKDGEDKKKIDTIGEINRINLMTKQILNQLNYPTRDPWILSFLEGITRITTGTASVESSPKIVKTPAFRLEEAVTCLSEVCDYIKTKRLQKYGINASPIILLDEFHDLIKDSKLALVGGQEIFDMLARKIVDDGVTAKRFRTVMAASSGKLVEDISNSTVSTRWWPYFLQDPSEADVKVALTDKGYKDDECQQIIDLVGTRVRLLEPIFTFESKLPVEIFISNSMDNAGSSFDTVFKAITDEADKVELMRILDSLSEGTDIVERISSFPSSIQNMDLHKLLYVKPEGKGEYVVIQSQLIRNVWPEWKKAYLAAKNKYNGTQPKQLK